MTVSVPQLSGKSRLGDVALKSLSPPARCRQAAVATADMAESPTVRLQGSTTQQWPNQPVVVWSLYNMIYMDATLSSHFNCLQPWQCIAQPKVSATRTEQCSFVAGRVYAVRGCSACTIAVPNTCKGP